MRLTLSEASKGSGELAKARKKRSTQAKEPSQRRRPTREELQAAYGRRVRDVIAHDLHVLFVGINPSLYTAAVGLHFGRPGNRFWPALERAGITDHILQPGEQRQLLASGFGITNIVPQATARADELSEADLIAGGKRLRRKIQRYRPRLVAFLGVTAYRAAFGQPDAEIGRLDEVIGNSEIWVLPNPSGLNAHYQLDDFTRFFRRLRRRSEQLAG